MKGKNRYLLLSLSIVPVFTVLIFAAQGFDIPWWSVDGGGEKSIGNAYTLVGTIGQPDTGTLRGGIYTIQGGFLAPSFTTPVAVENWRQY